MRVSISIVFLFLSLTICSCVKKAKDEDFSEFDDFDQDEFTIETSSPSPVNPSSSKAQTGRPVSNDFDEIDDDDDHDDRVSNPSANSKAKEDEVTIDDDDDSMFDEEEFETSHPFASPTPSSPDLKIAEVPANLTGNRWEAYHCEAIMVICLLGYLINFLIGRSKNARLANILFRSQRDLLERNFSVVGDNGQTRTAENSADEQIDQLMLKESESLYVLWCTGRVSIESMLVELRFIKRQCVFNSIAAMIKSINDSIVYTVDFGKDDMETFVFCLAKKRSATRLHRDMNDLSQFCPEKKNADKRGLSGNYQIISEIGEVSGGIIDSRIVEFIDRYPDALEYIHISDQFTGVKAQAGDQQSTTSGSSSTNGNSGSAAQQQDALNTSERNVRRVLIVAFNLISQGDRSLQVTMESIGSDYLRLVLHLMDRVASYSLPSKESKNKAIKNRQRVEEQFLKNVYQQRQEQAQQRREEKRRAEKEKIMQSDDPDLQRKWEEKEHKRELKRQKPKMKQMKIKAM